MKTVFLIICILLAGLQCTVAAENAYTHELRQYLNNTLWQWDGDGGETVFFNENGGVENDGWTKRHLITRWEVIDRRTVLLKIERGRSRDLYAILTFKEDLSSFDGWNFHGGSRIKVSYEIKDWQAGQTF